MVVGREEGAASGGDAVVDAEGEDVGGDDSEEDWETEWEESAHTLQKLTVPAPPKVQSRIVLVAFLTEPFSLGWV